MHAFDWLPAHCCFPYHFFTLVFLLSYRRTNTKNNVLCSYIYPPELESLVILQCDIRWMRMEFGKGKNGIDRQRISQQEEADVRQRNEQVQHCALLILARPAARSGARHRFLREWATFAYSAPVVGFRVQSRMRPPLPQRTPFVGLIENTDLS